MFPTFPFVFHSISFSLSLACVCTQAALHPHSLSLLFPSRPRLLSLSPLDPCCIACFLSLSLFLRKEGSCDAKTMKQRSRMKGREKQSHASGASIPPVFLFPNLHTQLLLMREREREAGGVMMLSHTCTDGEDARVCVA